MVNSLPDKLTRWFQANARDLPWRTLPAGHRDPYSVLVAEAMLQQTQVSRVLERYDAFLARFPTIQSLAAADELDVLALWSGLGYYRRAKSLHAAAKAIISDHGGQFPRDSAALLKLPGVGRYTAGAIASLAFNTPAPIVDGNVARVLLRLHGMPLASDDKSIQPWLWERATELVASAASSPPPNTNRAGLFNEAIMELGATICTPPPSLPACDRCPWKADCRARIDGTQTQIPLAKARAKQKNLFCAVALISRADGSLLVEQRPATGMWAGLWQAPTLESPDAPPTARDLALALGGGLKPADLRPETSFEHQTTHRRVTFHIWRAAIAAPTFSPSRGLWLSTPRIQQLGLSNPQRRILLESAPGGTLFT